jgi:hypothetical protein
MIHEAQCSQCGAPLTAGAIGAPVRCDYCGAQNHLSYDFAHDRLLMVRDRVDVLQLREDLEKRLVILHSNLRSIDPVAQWPEGGPSLAQGSMKVPGVLLGLGLLTIPVRGIGALLLIVGAVVLVSRLKRHADLAALYERDRVVSARNAALVGKLRAEACEYQSILAQLTGGTSI